MICDCEPFEVCPSCAPPWRGDGTVVVETEVACQHNHGALSNGELTCFHCGAVLMPSVEVPRTYTLEKIEALAREYNESRRVGLIDENVLNRELQLSSFLVFLAKREKELRG